MANSAVVRAGKSFPKPKLEYVVSREEYLRRTSFYDLLDFKGTMDMMRLEIKNYNQDLKDKKITKGRLRGIATITSILLKVLINEMEWYRVNNFDQYLLYMSAKAPTLPIYTNRGQISTMDENCPSLRTVTARLDKLTSIIDFITHKKNTSRVTLTRKDEEGNSYKVRKSLEGEKDANGQSKVGRGDFRLQINKKWLSFRSMAVKKVKKETTIVQISENFNSADNQRVTQPTTKILQQPSKEFISETLINHSNNCYSNSLNGVASQHQFINQDAINVFPIGDEKGKKIFSEDASGKPQFLKKVLQEIDGRPRLVALKNPKGQAYLDKFKKEKCLKENLPKSTEEYYATLLWYLLINRLYPKMHSENVITKTKFGVEMIKKHLTRLDLKGYNLDAGYWIIARAIDKAHDYAAKKDFDFMDPISYLRLDYSGSLITVIDNWVIEKELKLLELKKEANKRLMQYQDAILKTEELFLKIAKAYHESYFEGKWQIIQAGEELEDLFRFQNSLSENSKAKIRKDFADKIVVLIANLENQSTDFEVADNDPTWLNFENHILGNFLK